MKDCCVMFMGAGISSVHYCSGDMWNATANFHETKLVKFCPICGESMFNVIPHYPQLAEARGVKPREIK